MKYRFIEAFKNGDIVKDQKFNTDKGVYRITLVRYKNDIYFYKFRDGKIVECNNLSRAKTRAVKNNTVPLVNITQDDTALTPVQNNVRLTNLIKEGI